LVLSGIVLNCLIIVEIASGDPANCEEIL
jgi:hypothetical protein